MNGFNLRNGIVVNGSFGDYRVSNDIPTKFKISVYIKRKLCFIMSAVNLPFSLALTAIWNSLDDVLLCIGIVLISVPIIVNIGLSAQNYFKYSLWTGQMITFLLLTTVSLYLLGHVAGEASTVSILQGFALGVGYALQPYIVSLLSGATYFVSGIISANDVIFVDGKKYTIVSNGILYIEARSDDISIFVPNNFFNNTYLKKIDNKKI
jgi:hypothetical protein